MSACDHLVPLADRLVIIIDPPEEVRAGGLVVPPAEAPQTATVVATGPDVKELHPEDRIVYSKFALTELTVDGEELQLIREGEVLAKIRNAAG